MAMKTSLKFEEWLIDQQYREDFIGDLARVLSKQEFDQKATRRKPDEHKNWADIVLRIAEPGYITVFNEAWHECMTRVFIADSQLEVRSALRLLLLDLNMQVVGDAADWSTALTQAAGTQPDMLVVDWEMIPTNTSLLELRATCPAAVVIVLVSHLDARQQAALSAGADSFISKGETPDRVAERLRAAAQNGRSR